MYTMKVPGNIKAWKAASEDNRGQMHYSITGDRLELQHMETAGETAADTTWSDADRYSYNIKDSWIQHLKHRASSYGTAEAAR